MSDLKIWHYSRLFVRLEGTARRLKIIASIGSLRYDISIDQGVDMDIETEKILLLTSDPASEVAIPVSSMSAFSIGPQRDAALLRIEHKRLNELTSRSGRGMKIEPSKNI